MILHFERRGVFGALYFFIIFVQVTLLTAQKGFLSIDCGGNSPLYTDIDTKLTWTNDANYNLTGLIGMVPYEVDPNTNNYVALQRFRYFPERGRETKHCYNVSIGARNISVLVRAMFLHGNSPELSLPPLPTSFDVYIDATFWDSIEYSIDNSLDDLRTPKILEGIFLFVRNTANVCLVPRQGVPFISSLELRELDPDGIMYSFDSMEVREDLFLSRIIRWNFGSCASTLRYPEDNYDRLWTCPTYQLDETTGLFYLDNITLPSAIAGKATENFVPRNIMANGTSPRGFVGFGFTLELPRDLSSSTRLYAIFYFLDQISQSGSQLMNISFQGQRHLDVTIHNNSVSMEAYPHSIVSSNTVSMTFSSNAKPIVNAMEIYEEKIVNHYSTQPQNAILIDLLMTTFDLAGQGDPCIPVSYEWITCIPSKQASVWVFSFPTAYASKYSGEYYPMYLESINLSYLNNTASLQKLSPGNYFGLVLLESVSIIHSDLNDNTFQFLLENITSTKQASYLTSLDVTNNSITKFTSSMINSNRVLQVLNLSRNLFTGEAPSFDDLSQPEFQLTKVNPIQILNMSSNSLSAFPRSWEDETITDYPHLGIIDLSNNKLSNLSSLYRFVQQPTSQLEAAYLFNNNIAGDFPSDLYFSNASKLRILNLDRNGIQGVLDLTHWQEKMQLFMEQSMLSSLTAQMVLSLVNNSIKDINPDVASLELFIDDLRNSTRFNRSGILLGGNPYCKGASSFAHLYMCRSSIDEQVHEKERENNGRNVALIIGATLGGVFATVLCSILLVIIVKLRKQVLSLKEFQLELASKKVQPPLYSYEDLKLATRDFHENNKLGSGTFGAVYRGELRDGSLVAVKVLFYNQEEDNPRVMDQFLNEVVLITNIRHKHLVQLQGCCVRGKKKILVYEFAENGDLADALWGKRAKTSTLSWKNRLNICIGVARGLSYLHEGLQPRIIHRDIKAANILLDISLNPKIADFGLAKPFQEEDTHAQFSHVAGTRGYWAPEYVLDGQLTQKADVYSFGILVLEIVSGRQSIVATLPEEEVSLKKWAETLQGEERPLQLLQAQLRDKCPEDEVRRVINTALLCVESNPGLRPTMSAAVFMLVGGTETHIFESFSREEDQGLRKFQSGSILSTIGGLAAIDESELSPLVLSSQYSRHSSNPFSGGQSSTVPSFELSEIDRFR